MLLLLNVIIHPMPPLVFMCYFYLLFMFWMVIVRKKKLVICLVPATQLGVPITSFKRVHAFQIELEFRSVGFLGGGRGKPEYPVILMFHSVLLQFCLNFDIDISWYSYFIPPILRKVDFSGTNRLLNRSFPSRRRQIKGKGLVTIATRRGAIWIKRSYVIDDLAN